MNIERKACSMKNSKEDGGIIIMLESREKPFTATKTAELITKLKKKKSTLDNKI